MSAKHGKSVTLKFSAAEWEAITIAAAAAGTTPEVWLHSMANTGAQFIAAAMRNLPTGAGGT